MADMQFGYDRASQRFRDLSTGKFVSERSVRDGVDRVADLASARMGEAAARFRAGELTATQFQAVMLQTIKDSQIAAALAAYGGRAQMTPERWGVVGQAIRAQYAYARQMVADVLDGRQRMNGRLDARARQYGQAARSLYENVRRREATSTGMLYEQNHIHAAESCEMCLAMSRRGKVPLGSLVPIGQRTCRQQCRCTLSYHRSTVEMVEAA
jgi:hypothetical protein